MPRIAPEELQRLKTEVSLARLIEGQGHRLTPQGKDLACRCPWHAGDDTPSCIISPKTNLWHCFGCNAGGTVIDWVMRSHRVSFRHACELLAKQHPALAAAVSKSAPAATAAKLSQGKLRAAQSFSLAAGDLHYVGLARGLSGYVVPSRLYGILAAGRPALVSADADSETARLVEEVGCGLVLPPGRPDLVAGVIRDVVEGRLSLEGMGERGRDWVEREADREVAFDRYRRLVADVESSSR